MQGMSGNQSIVETSPEHSPEARTSKIQCKPMEEQNPRLTTGSSPVYQRFITGTRSALSSWLLTSGPTPFCLCKPFSCKACPGTKEKHTTYNVHVAHGSFAVPPLLKILRIFFATQPAVVPKFVRLVLLHHLSNSCLILKICKCFWSLN